MFAITSTSFIPWRIEDLDEDRIIQANITEINDLENLFYQHQFKTIFDLAAYGAYSKQTDTELIYQTNDTEAGWNGTYKGAGSPMDVYVWKCEFKNIVTKENESHIGHVTLVR